MPEDTTRAVPVLFLDIDGTVRHGKDELGRFVNSADDVIVFPEAVARMQEFKVAGGRIVGVSNQAGIALGYMTAEACVEALHETNRQTGELFDIIRFCGHHPGQPCECRKPQPGMVYQAIDLLLEEHPDEKYPPYQWIVVGDRPEDAALAASCGAGKFIDADLWRAVGTG